MRRLFRAGRFTQAFSLVEIVLAVGIVSIALLAIFAVFSAAVRTSGETISQHELIGITRAFSDAVRTTNTGTGILNYGTISNALASSGAASSFFFIDGTGSITNTMSASTADGANNRPGRLYRLEIGLSPNVPGITNVASLATNAFIPVQVRIYQVPVAAASFDTNRTSPVFTYETSVFR